MSSSFKVMGWTPKPMDLCRHLCRDIRALLQIMRSPNEFPHPNFNTQLRMGEIIYCVKRGMLLIAREAGDVIDCCAYKK
jgi:hypothetical protein